MRRRKRNPNPGWAKVEPVKYNAFTEAAAIRQGTDPRRRGMRPVFDRGSFAPIDEGLAKNVANGVHIKMYRTAADRQPAKEVVTARLLGDPPPHRAGRAPDCEDSLRVERSMQAYRLLGRDPPSQDEYGILDLDAVQEKQRRLAPRRWRPKVEAAE